MGSWVTLSALGVEFAVALEGVGEADARQFVEAWQWCGARSTDSVPRGATIIRAAVDDGRSGRGASGGDRGAARGDDRGVAAAEPGSGAREQRITAHSYRALADHLSGLITRLAIDERRGDLLMFHAGGVADPETGAVIAFIGPSGRGKTTASIALGSVFDYVTDETLAVRDDLEVIAYGKPLSVKPAPPEAFKDQVSPTALGLNRPGAVPLRLVGVVMLDRQASFEAERLPSVRPVGVAESVEELVPQISYLPERERPLQRLVEVLGACGGLQQVTYGEAATLPEVFAKLFAAAAARGAGAGVADDVGAAESGGRATATGAGEVDARGGVEGLQASYIDAVRDGEALVVLSGTTVRVLGGIAPTIVEETSGAALTMAEVVRRVVEVHGSPGGADAGELVAAAVQELTEIGLLKVVGAK
ncbi:hypothetical protein [Subtercola lobariae]|uniref:Uncharacterized protein n=1 Tax=Subtercola lobariae TaxID=1588641 RepID=A0A917B0M4_9MICO|nr:hypothetical protein [Subtercola lobariae]GGF13100.1 hypothetical protein GCM10011399_03760 [Subtercola lobariae]